MKLRELRLSTRITISAMIIVAAGAASLAFIENTRIRDAYISELRTHLKNDLETEKLLLNQAVDTLRQDVLFLSNTPPVSGIVRAALNHGYDPRYGNTHKVWAERLEQIFTAFSQAHPNYFKIRYIGVADGGREIVRITNRGGKIEITPFEKLQSKSNRDYFKATLGLHNGQVHLSEFDLTEEWGVIERPDRPTFRASTPVFTPSGEIFGMVVISLDVSSLLISAGRNLPTGTQAYIADVTGQYLLHPDSQKTFAPGTGSRNKITTDFPFVETMFNLLTPDYLPLQTITTRSGNALICAMRIHFDSSDRSRFLLLLHSTPEAVAEQHIATIPIQQIGGGLIGMLLVGGIAMLVLRRTFAPLEKIAASADIIAAGNHDVLLPQYGSGEIGSLTNALNTMLTQLSQREKSLRESEVKYRRLHESMMDAFVMVDMSGRLIEFNHAYQEMLGYSAEELLRLTYVDLTPEKWREFEAQIVNEQIIPHGKSPVYEKEYIRKDGTVFPVELKAFLLRDKNSQPEAMWAIVRDITERKKWEFQLGQLNFALNHMNDAVYLMNEKGRFQYVNDEACRVLGYAREELIDKMGVPDIGQGWTNEMWAEHWQDVKTNGSRLLEAAHIAKDGHTFPIEVNANFFVYGGQSYIMSLVRDITERKQAEIGLRKSAEEIEDLYNHAPCGYHSLDKEGIFRQINDTELAWLGYTRDEVMWKMKLTDLLTPAGIQTCHETFPRLMQQGFAHNIELEIIRKDGTTFTALLNSLAIYDSGGNFVMSRSTVIDITERKRVNRQLQELSAHLQTVREEEKARIAREIHDDLGGTLTALKMDAYWLAKKLPEDKAAAPLLKRINSMSQLLDSAVSVTRRIITDLRPAMLDDLGLLATLEWHAAQFHKRTGIRCRVNCIEDKGTLDKQRSIALFRIFQETLTNIARHSGATRVEVEFHCDDKKVMLLIRDNGRGVPENHTISSTSFGQRGMSERVEQLGGNISFESPPGGGFYVTVMLPLPDEGKKEETS